MQQKTRIDEVKSSDPYSYVQHKTKMNEVKSSDLYSYVQ